MSSQIDTNQIKDWRSIITLIVFVITNVIVLFPFHIPLWLPRWMYNGFFDLLSYMRIIPPREPLGYEHHPTLHDSQSRFGRMFIKVRFPMDLVTAPLIADLFLLAILAIGREEVHDGTVGADSIHPIDVMVFFITLAYIAISIDASGLIRWLAYKVLQRGGENGRRLFFYLYTFFFVLTGLVGNDPTVLSGSPFLAYMTRVSANIKSPRAWIFSQFAMANVGSAILVSSNPTNLVLAGAFGIKFIHYTANVIVPVVATVIVLFPIMLFIVFRNKDLVPPKIELHELPEEAKLRDPVNPNIPRNYVISSRDGQDETKEQREEREQLASLEEIMNPYLDKVSATVGAVVMAATLITILALNASSSSGSEVPVFYITLPAAAVMLCWDLTFGWIHRHETRAIARGGLEKTKFDEKDVAASADLSTALPEPPKAHVNDGDDKEDIQNEIGCRTEATETRLSASKKVGLQEKSLDQEARPTLQSKAIEWYKWLQETFPTAMAVLSHLPYKLVPFAFCMFVLVQGLVTKGWVPVFAHGWDEWVKRTGVVGAIGGMAFVSVILCNFAGTNIGTTILLCRIIQAWVEIRRADATPISQRTFWATVYSMAIGVNYGAFSIAFSASLAGLLWRDILARKGIKVGSLDFVRINVPIITVSMIVGCAVLVGEVYITRNQDPYTG
ncbi:hypothetical protein M409DRAFT_15762 [Zasmidium cellare ATCC 36951]|uniref:Citrate transporter-like domain-containing protein n=1 Tax=Zasmidium cellare ATCC 36951 TaxID=1080233 RepID=A0A6A6D284_ZASCE|nr:uncharacterized protein M409DRAFT_15762 [Zasmidium cellare ATCC 36951]KAF2173481.1 hypothetical protein M409DRAFT_15762 [Zasmidium cellare ATCC 36951]